MAVFLIAYSVLLLLGAAWAHSDGQASSKEVLWAGMRAVVTAFVTWGIVRLRPWAWWVGTVVSAVLVVLAVLGAVALLAGSVLGGQESLGLYLDPRALLLLAATLLSLVAALGTLIAGLVRRVTDSSDAILRTPARLIGIVLLAVPLLAGALTVRAVRNPNQAFVPVNDPQQAYPVAPTGVGSAPVQAKKAAPTGLQLPDGFGSIAVDAERGRVLVSSPTANVVSVLDLGGRALRRVEVPGGPGGLLVDGDRLYVVASAAGRIAVLDASTFESRGNYGSGLVKPGPLVKAGGRLWTSTGECGRFETSLVSIDPRSGATVVHAPIDSLRYCIDLATSPADTNLLLGYEPGLSPATLVRVDVSGPTPVVVTSRRSPPLGNLRQLAFLPGGDRFVAASGAPYEILEFRTADLAESGLAYPAEAYPVSVAITFARGGMVAAGIDSSGGPDVVVSRSGNPADRIATLELGPDRSLIVRSLAWSPDGTSVYALSSEAQGRDVRLHVLKP